MRPFVFLLVLLSSCIDIYENISSVDIADIKKRGHLVALTSYGPNSYFLYKGQPMGYEYELLSRLAQDLGVRLEIVTVKDLDNIPNMLNSGAGDIVAANIVVTRKKTRSLEFTEHLTLTRQVLVQRAPGYTPPKAEARKTELVRSTVDLIGKRVHVRGGSPFHTRLKNLSEEIGGEIEVVEVPASVLTEDLIKQVSEGEIDYTVADESTALINRAYYPGIDTETPISFPQRIAWVVRNKSPELRETVNAWIRKMKTTDGYAAIYNRYYRDPIQYRDRLASQFFSPRTGMLSQYDPVFKKAAAETGIDWRLLAAVAYQESRFDPAARSWAGAQGIMQLMPPTAASLGVNPANPEENIRGGSRYLKMLIEQWKDQVSDPDERVKFALASYNAGFAHVEDARKLARKHGKNDSVWFDQTELFILALARPEFFNDPVVQYGYLRGEEPFNYVRAILDRYEHYKKLVKDPALPQKP